MLTCAAIAQLHGDLAYTKLEGLIARGIMDCIRWLSRQLSIGKRAPPAKLTIVTGKHLQEKKGSGFTWPAVCSIVLEDVHHVSYRILEP